MSIELQRPTLNVQTQFDLVLPSSRRRAVAHPQSHAQATDAPQRAQQGEAPGRSTPEGNPALTQAEDRNTRGGGRRVLRNLPNIDYRE